MSHGSLVHCTDVVWHLCSNGYWCTLVCRKCAKLKLRIMKALLVWCSHQSAQGRSRGTPKGDSNEIMGVRGVRRRRSRGQSVHVHVKIIFLN